LPTDRDADSGRHSVGDPHALSFASDRYGDGRAANVHVDRFAHACTFSYSHATAY